EAILQSARSLTKPVSPKRLGLAMHGLNGYHAKQRGTHSLTPGRGSVAAELPYTVEAWCNRSCDDKDHITVFVNRTPVTGELEIRRAEVKTDVNIFGCNLGHCFTVGRKPIDIVINIQIPY